MNAVSTYPVTRPSLRGRQGETLLALLPALGVMLWWRGSEFLMLVAVALFVAVTCDFGLGRWRRLPWTAIANDLGCLIHAVLLAFWLPLLTPWWVVAAGAAVSVVIRHVYGGTSQSPWHPTLVGVASVLMLAPETFATARDEAFPWAASAAALGAGWMLWRGWTSRVAALALLASAVLAYWLASALTPANLALPWRPEQALHWWLVAGFVLADRDAGLPARAAAVLGTGIALLTLLLQLGGLGLSAALALAVLAMNLFTPWLDRRLEPSVFRRNGPA